MTLHGSEISRERIAAFCQTTDMHRLLLFGSILREDFRPSANQIGVLLPEMQP